MPTGWKVSKIQGRSTSCVTMTRRIKDLTTNTKTEFLSCLQNRAFALQMSRFTDTAQPVSAPTTPQRIFFYVNAQQWTQVVINMQGVEWLLWLSRFIHLHDWCRSNGREYCRHHNMNQGSEWHETLTSGGSHGLLSHSACAVKKKKKPFSLKNVLDEALKIINFY